MRLHSQTLLRLVVSYAVAITLDFFIWVKWWHPYCDSQADGPGYWASGFPFPYAEPTGVSSGEFTLLIPIYIVNLTILAIVIFGVLHFLWQSIAVRILVGGVFGIVAAVVRWLTSMLSWPQFEMRFSSYDMLKSYRPAFVVDFNQHRNCAGS